jgi:hypothetical protein
VEYPPEHFLALSLEGLAPIFSVLSTLWEPHQTAPATRSTLLSGCLHSTWSKIPFAPFAISLLWYLSAKHSGTIIFEDLTQMNVEQSLPPLLFIRHTRQFLS